MKIVKKVKDALFRAKLRKAATRLVDFMHDNRTETILLCGTSSQPAFSLVAEAWRRRYPQKPLPTPMPVNFAKQSDVQGKRIALFDELSTSGSSLWRAYSTIKHLEPKDATLVALLKTRRYPLNNAFAGAAYNGRDIQARLSLDERRFIGEAERDRRTSIDVAERRQMAESAKYWAKQVREKRNELREIASSIKPRKLKTE